MFSCLIMVMLLLCFLLIWLFAPLWQKYHSLHGFLGVFFSPLFHPWGKAIPYGERARGRRALYVLVFLYVPVRVEKMGTRTNCALRSLKKRRAPMLCIQRRRKMQRILD